MEKMRRDRWIVWEAEGLLCIEVKVVVKDSKRDIGK